MLDLIPVMWQLVCRVLLAALTVALIVTAGAIYYVLK